jgi:dihydroorotate dehydrogenase (fumarate)
MDLTTHYMGLTLKHPVVASASPLSESLDGIRHLEDGGASAVVMFSLFEEQIRLEKAAVDRLLTRGTESFAESLSYFPEVDDFAAGPDDYLDLVRRASEATDIPIIASLNCVTSEGWIEYARQMEQAGARGLELNIYAIEANPKVSGQEVEQRYLDILKLVKQTVSIPVALKLSPFFSAFGHFAKCLDEAGADALVLFNRFYQPDMDIDSLEISPTLTLSEAYEIRMPLLWIALLYGKVRASLGATRGVETYAEVVKYLLAGADIVMTASALLRNGPAYSGKLVSGLKHWMEEHGFVSLQQMRGVMSHAKAADPTAFERANYIKTLESYH